MLKCLGYIENRVDKMLEVYEITQISDESFKNKVA